MVWITGIYLKLKWFGICARMALVEETRTIEKIIKNIRSTTWDTKIQNSLSNWVSSSLSDLFASSLIPSVILVKVLGVLMVVAGSLLGDKLTGLKGFAPTSLMQLLSNSSTFSKSWINENHRLAVMNWHYETFLISNFLMGYKMVTWYSAKRMPGCSFVLRHKTVYIG